MGGIRRELLTLPPPDVFVSTHSTMKNRPGRKITRERLVALTSAGRTPAQIAKEIGCSYKTVRTSAIKWGISLAYRCKRFTPEQVKDICISVKNGIPLKVLMERYSRDKTTIRQVYQAHGIRSPKKSTVAAERLRHGEPFTECDFNTAFDIAYGFMLKQFGKYGEDNILSAINSAGIHLRRMPRHRMNAPLPTMWINVAKLRLFDILRVRKRYVPLSPYTPANAATPVDQLGEQEDTAATVAAVRKAVRKLPENLRDIIQAEMSGEGTWETRSKALGISTATYAVHLRKAYAMLRELLPSTL